MQRVGDQIKAKRGCWTCKGRKIGCDRGRPSCSNCIRTDRQCKGYGIKLSWPQNGGDGRRRDFVPDQGLKDEDYNTLQTHGSSSKSLDNIIIHNTRKQFLNTDYEDLRRFLGHFTPLQNLHRAQNEASSKPTRGLSYGYETYVKSEDSSLLSYYVNVISRMITTIDDGKNGFHTFLVPIATSTSSLSSQSLMKAILALAAFHLHGEKSAIKYKVEAFRLLFNAIEKEEDSGIAQVAASLMLCVCDVFDLADGSWSLHLSAAKTLANRLRLFENASDNLGFLETWLLYHEVLSNYSLLPTGSVSAEDITVPAITAKNTIIIGALGCSLELFQIISCINHLAGIVQQRHTLPLNHILTAQKIAARLGILSQIVNSTPPPPPQVRARILITAELYRIATQVYLQRSVLQTPRMNSITQLLVTNFLEVLKTLEVCTSPWPLFVVACEAITDEHRLLILEVLEKMQCERRIKNVDMVRMTVETLWKQIDLETDFVHADRICWRDLGLFGKGRIPSFI